MDYAFLLTALFIVTFGFLLLNMMRKKLGLSLVLFAGLFAFHLGFTYLYYDMSMHRVADANLYYNRAFFTDFSFRPGTIFVTDVAGLMVQYLQFAKLHVFLVFSMMGLAGILLLAHVIIPFWSARRGWSRYIPYGLIFLPGLHFWSSALGKDAPAFLAVNLAIYAVVRFPRRLPAFIAAVLIMLSVRPHIAVLMAAALVTALMLGVNSRLWQKLLLVAAGAIVLSGMMDFVLEYVGLTSFSNTDQVLEFVEKRQSANMEGGSSIDLASMNPVMRFASYLFRPHVLEARGLNALVAAGENALLLAFFLLYFVRFAPRLMFEAAVSIRYNEVFFLVGTIVLSTLTANLGIALRQKIMLLPSLFFAASYVANLPYWRKALRRGRRAALNRGQWMPAP